jgi:RsiW-degrading membrane proteinase PrsW (M82 family)
MVATFGIILAVVLPLVVLLGIIRKADSYQTGQSQVILVSLLFGMLACKLASFTNFSLVSYNVADPENIVRFLAPIYEEIFKGLFLLILLNRRKFNYSVDGALYGFSIGIGFAIAENIGYIDRSWSEALTIALQRIFSADLVHASSSAIFGIALWMFYLKRTRRRWLFLATGLILAISLHMVYNNAINSGRAPLTSAFGIGILAAFFVYFAMQAGKAQARAWIRQQLGMRDGVTPGEVAMVNRLPTMDDLLQPVFDRFGSEKTRQVEKLLYIQARLGIKRNFLESTPQNDPSSNTVEQEMRAMRTEMKAAQRAVGAYAMLFVRRLYTDEVISVWEQIQSKILAQSAQKSGQKGGGVWSSLEDRLKTPAGADMESRE